MPKSKILLQPDPDTQPRVFYWGVALDSDVDQLLRHGGVSPEVVESLVHGTMFTRGPADLKSTAIFVGGSNVTEGERVFEAVQKCFFGPMRVSVMIDSSGANTTAAAAVLAATRHVDLSGSTALVLAATGPVGHRVARLLARQGAAVRAASRSVSRAQEVCDAVTAVVDGARLSAHETSTDGGLQAALDGTDVVIAAGAAGIELLSSDARAAADALKVAVDLNAVPPSGIGGIDVMDQAAERDGALCYGAIGVGGLKMKIHKAAIRSLFESNDLVLDAEEIFAIGQELSV
jgi:hypothetical protein